MITNEKNLKSSLKQYLKFSNPMIFNCLVIDKENCFNSGTSNAAMSDIKCQQREIYLLKWQSKGSEEMDIFIAKIPKD